MLLIYYKKSSLSVQNLLYMQSPFSPSLLRLNQGGNQTEPLENYPGNQFLRELDGNAVWQKLFNIYYKNIPKTET